MNLKSLVAVQSVLLVLALGGLLYTNVQLGSLSSRLETLESAPAPEAKMARGERSAPDGMRERRRIARVAPQAAPQGNANVDDALWSENGRAAIDDVVTEREEREAEKRTERWQQMREIRTQRTVDRAQDEMGLSDADAEALLELMTTYSEARGNRWKMMNDDDADPAQIMEQAEQAREQFRSDLVALLGEEGADELRGMMRGPGF